VKSAHIVTVNQPMKGLAAFVPVFPTSHRLARNEGQTHPGEGSA